MACSAFVARRPYLHCPRLWDAVRSGLKGFGNVNQQPKVWGALLGQMQPTPIIAPDTEAHKTTRLLAGLVGSLWGPETSHSYLLRELRDACLARVQRRHAICDFWCPPVGRESKSLDPSSCREPEKSVAPTPANVGCRLPRAGPTRRRFYT